MRVLVHPGFHKTGTSSLQQAVLAQRDVLEARVRLLLINDMRAAIRIARRYSVHPSQSRLDAFKAAFYDFAHTIDATDPRPLLISSEALAGQIPGRKNVVAYDATPALVKVVTDVLNERLGSDTSMVVWFTTREPDAWQRSAYWQNLRSTRITEDFETYRGRLHRAAKLDDVVTLVREGLATSARVVSTRIEKCGAEPLGPLGEALDLLEVSKRGLFSVPTKNVQPPGAAEEFLRLNRSTLDDAALKETKTKLFKRYSRLRRSGR